MKRLKIVATSVALIVLTGMYTTAAADTTNANCELYKKGELKYNASGHCQFSQRQGYVDITLRNGKTFSLSPGNKANHFKDQKGNKVVRSDEGHRAHRYKWDHKRIIVSFNNKGNSSSSQSATPSGTPHSLRDLIGQRGGEAEDQLMSRGYKLKNSSESGGSIYSSWKERSTGHCVMVRSDARSGLYKSIVYTMDADCQH